MWVPQGTAVALLGLAEDGMSAVAYFPWLSAKLAEEHRRKNAVCANTIAKVSLTTIKFLGGRSIGRLLSKLYKYFWAIDTASAGWGGGVSNQGVTSRNPEVQHGGDA